MYKRILVPLNGSKNAEVVLPHVIEMANGRNSEIVLLRVSIPPEINLIAEDPECVQYSHPDTEVQCQDYLQHVATKLESQGVRATIRIGRGVPDDVILKIAKEIQPDVIVVSKRKGQHILHTMHGCVAERILHKAEMPVLLVGAPD